MVGITEDMRSRCARWDGLKRWERRELARELRSQGLSYREIGLLIPAAKGSLSLWCRDVELSEATLASLQNLRSCGRQVAMAQVGQRRHHARQLEIQALRAAARRDAGVRTNDPAWVAGMVAYWAEGAKTSNRLKFSNSDPSMIRLFIAWSRTYLDRGPEAMTCHLHLHSGQTERDEISYWSRVTGIDERNFGRSFIKPTGTGHRKRILYHGVATVAPRRSTDLLHTVLGWIDGYVETIGLT